MTRIMIVPTIVTAQIVIIPSVFATVNPDNLTTLDRMRFTAIQMTILSLESEQPTNMSNDEIATQIYKHQQSNKSNDRLTTFEIETLYRNITNGSQVGPDEINGN